MPEKAYEADPIPKSNEQHIQEAKGLSDFVSITKDPAYEYYLSTKDKEGWKKNGSVTYFCTVYADSDHQIELDHFSLFEEDLTVSTGQAIEHMIDISLNLRDGQMRYDPDTKNAVMSSMKNEDFPYLNEIREYLFDEENEKEL